MIGRHKKYRRSHVQLCELNCLLIFSTLLFSTKHRFPINSGPPRTKSLFCSYTSAGWHLPKTWKRTQFSIKDPTSWKWFLWQFNGRRKSEFAIWNMQIIFRVKIWICLMTLYYKRSSWQNCCKVMSKCWTKALLIRWVMENREISYFDWHRIIY